MHNWFHPTDAADIRRRLEDLKPDTRPAWGQLTAGALLCHLADPIKVALGEKKARRLQTPVGPVRLDLGIRPTLVERLPVITEITLPDSSTQLVTLAARRRYDPLDRSGGWLRGILSRLRLHLAIGPPF